jgi:hypothetical protein
MGDIWINRDIAQGLVEAALIHTRQELARVQAERDELAERLKVCQRIVAAQAQDDALWSPVGIVEAYVIQELRTLHRAVEGDLSAVAAIEDL